jgi:glycosyltransferase involved in cell wall biosynthesis
MDLSPGSEEEVLKTEPVRKLSIVVLTRNEGNSIGAVLREILAKVKNPFEILVVDDSTDDTARIVQAFSSVHSNIRLRPQEGRGYTRALTTAVKYFEGDAMVVLVGDGSDEIADIDRMSEKMQEGYDLVCASRYMRGGARAGGASVQGFFSSLVCKSLKMALGINTCDVSNSFKLYRRELLSRIEIKDSGFAASMQITLKSFFQGCRIAEIPTIWRNRGAGSSKFRFRRHATHYLYWYVWAVLKGIAVRIPFKGASR